ncbi:hypothetical protein P7D52_00160 [Enterococcus dongliensis]|uniref:hypothetical protein n=1 Tax=Enterococcus dongliensis TaxID=2559925 RepID=UPI00288E03A1|nr:hypothetical protein [Enterococcus dongliensis]MDT2641225.1 hypothetical protein [Enterococcus dongliensis]
MTKRSDDMWVIQFFLFVKEWWFLIVMIGSGVYSLSRGISSINNNLNKIFFELKTFNEKIILSERDRAEIHEDLKDHDNRLDKHDIQISRHDEQLKTLWTERKRGK